MKMNTKLRLVRSPEEEKAIFFNKEKEANVLLNSLIVQCICFKKIREYGLIHQIYKNYNKDKNVNTYLESVEKLKFLFDLGVPSENDIKQIKIAMAQIKLLGDVEFDTAEKKIQSNILARLLFRAALFKRYKSLAEISSISSNYRAYENVQKIQELTKPYLYLLEINN